MITSFGDCKVYSATLRVTISYTYRKFRKAGALFFGGFYIFIIAISVGIILKLKHYPTGMLALFSMLFWQSAQ